MNPLVKVTSAAGTPADLCSTAAAANGTTAADGAEAAAGSSLLQQQDLVIATGLPLQQVGMLVMTTRNQLQQDQKLRHL